MKIALILCSWLLFSCSSSVDRIEFPQNNIEDIRISMNTVRDALNKSQFDTVAIKEFLVESEVETSHLYNIKINRDSIKRKIIQDFDDYLPLHKYIYYSKNGEILLNNRMIGSNYDEFEKNIANCKEFESLNKSEKERFVKSFIILVENNISSCRESYSEAGKARYYFDYSQTNLYSSESSSRYLYLEKDAENNIDLIDNYQFLNEKRGIFLYRKK